MANELDEITGPINEEGREINVVNKQISVEVGFGSLLFEISLWSVLPIVFLIMIALGLFPIQTGIFYVIGGFLPGLIFLFMKINALAYLRQLQQKIQADASQIDNYLEQRVMILRNVVGLLDKAIDLDKDVMKTVAAYRSGVNPTDDNARNEASQQLDGVLNRINVAFEDYPDLKAHAAIADAMQQNGYLQKEITAARNLYNDTVAIWNQDIFAWPTKQIVAARNRYTTRIPFTASASIKAEARGTFF